MLSYAITILKNKQEAEDIVSTVLGEKFYNNRDKLAATATTGDLNFPAWFRRVTRNLCFNVIRDRRRRDNKLTDAKRQDYPGFYAVLFAYSGSNTIDQLYARETQKRIEDAVQNLSPDHQQILQLRYGEDLSYKEIVKTLGIKMGTVMSRLCRAKSRLQELAPDLEELLAA